MNTTSPDSPLPPLPITNNPALIAHGICMFFSTGIALPICMLIGEQGARFRLPVAIGGAIIGAIGFGLGFVEKLNSSGVNATASNVSLNEVQASSSAALGWHAVLGYAVLGLVLVRIVAWMLTNREDRELFAFYRRISSLVPLISALLLALIYIQVGLGVVLSLNGCIAGEGCFSPLVGGMFMLVYGAAIVGHLFGALTIPHGWWTPEIVEGIIITVLGIVNALRPRVEFLKEPHTYLNLRYSWMGIVWCFGGILSLLFSVKFFPIPHFLRHRNPIPALVLLVTGTACAQALGDTIPDVISRFWGGCLQFGGLAQLIHVAVRNEDFGIDSYSTGNGRCSSGNGGSVSQAVAHISALLVALSVGAAGITWIASMSSLLHVSEQYIHDPPTLIQILAALAFGWAVYVVLLFSLTLCNSPLAQQYARTSTSPTSAGADQLNEEVGGLLPSEYRAYRRSRASSGQYYPNFPSGGVGIGANGMNGTNEYANGGIGRSASAGSKRDSSHSGSGASANFNSLNTNGNGSTGAGGWIVGRSNPSAGPIPPSKRSSILFTSSPTKDIDLGREIELAGLLVEESEGENDEENGENEAVNELEDVDLGYMRGRGREQKHLRSPS
ncbi:uncharacterized protein VTP21DRAFT_8736 [Calcarisporiella thermophila]|uniref:uncharacterized protein n=1 Tax=Calcarisporiella thermophila TaxID=911321 RepID=UPI0037430CD2